MGTRLYGSKRKARDVVSEADIEALIENEEDFYCKLCDIYCNSEILLDTHLSGKKHKAKEAKNGGIRSSDPRKGGEEEDKKQLWCEICKVRCNSGVIMETHLNGKKHRANAESERKKKKGFWCAVCEVELNNQVLMEAHVNGKKHRAKEARLGGETGEGQVQMMVYECGDGNGKGLVEEKRNGDDGGVQAMESEGENEEGSEVLKKNGNDGKRRIAKAENERKGFWCELCEVELNNEDLMETHVNGKKHKAKEARLGGKRGGVWKREEEGQIEMIVSECEDGNEKGLMEEEGNGDDGGVQLVASEGEDEEASSIRGQIGIGKSLMEEKVNENDVGDQIMATECEAEEESNLQDQIGKGKGLMEEKKANENDGGLQGKKNEGEEEENKEFWCLGCKVKYDSRTSMAKHLNGMEHKMQQALRLGKPMNGLE